MLRRGSIGWARFSSGFGRNWNCALFKILVTGIGGRLEKGLWDFLLTFLGYTLLCTVALSFVKRGVSFSLLFLFSHF